MDQAYTIIRGAIMAVPARSVAACAGLPSPSGYASLGRVPRAQPVDHQLQAVLERGPRGLVVELAEGSGEVRVVTAADGSRQLDTESQARLGTGCLLLPLGGGADDVRAEREQRVLRLPGRQAGVDEDAEHPVGLGEGLQARAVAGHHPRGVAGGDQRVEDLP